jgi:hypothetical protein
MGPIGGKASSGLRCSLKECRRGVDPFEAPAVLSHHTLDELKTRKATCLIAALALVTLTAGCLQDSQYPTAGYGPGYTTGYGSRPVYTTGSLYGPAYTAPTQGSWNSANRDYDRDGIPNQYDRDANGDGVPDRDQGRR